MIFTFKDDALVDLGTEDPWYALTEGGYLKPEDVLTNEGQIGALNDAIKLVESFIRQCYEFGAIEES